ncbi:uncharacterized protein LY79DRAFT_391458 [Colletotrichum navitas]|uniref:Uncharacterized protein n=1 Tax=Colletotrichum navitas TaxID=681940 RepID=A0AAD8PPK1_9PEZI|nr:uncharacterized protein LY79DRAFT_391458 [Colletotrichum navitas]KAK1574059.1 hypothetical protein LY79DRAFT_391458 [Colletotrichum navitas]
MMGNENKQINNKDDDDDKLTTISPCRHSVPNSVLGTRKIAVQVCSTTYCREGIHALDTLRSPIAGSRAQSQYLVCPLTSPSNVLLTPSLSSRATRRPTSQTPRAHARHAHTHIQRTQHTYTHTHAQIPAQPTSAPDGSQTNTTHISATSANTTATTLPTHIV